VDDRCSYTDRQTNRQTDRGRAFQLDRQTGDLSVTQLFQQTDTARPYRLLITAVDHGTPPRSATASLIVTVLHHAVAQGVMTSRVGVSVYVTSAVCVGCFLVAALLLAVAMKRRCRRHGDRGRHDNEPDHDEDVSARSQQLHDTAHILAKSLHPAKPRPLRDLDRDVTCSRLQVNSALRI